MGTAIRRISRRGAWRAPMVVVAIWVTCRVCAAHRANTRGGLHRRHPTSAWSDGSGGRPRRRRSSGRLVDRGSGAAQPASTRTQPIRRRNRGRSLLTGHFVCSRRHTRGRPVVALRTAAHVPRPTASAYGSRTGDQGQSLSAATAGPPGSHGVVPRASLPAVGRGHPSGMSDPGRPRTSQSASLPRPGARCHT